MNLVIVGALVLVAFVNTISSKDYIRGCYFLNFSPRWKGVKQFTPESIEPGLCSHIFFGYVGMNKEFKLVPTDANDEDVGQRKGLYSRINDIKLKQPDLKTVLTFGGYEFKITNGTIMEEMLSKPENRRVFIDSAIAYVRRIGYDAFDLNWIPSAEDKDSFGDLIKELRESINKEAISTNKTRLLLGTVISGDIDVLKIFYDLKALSESVDALFVQTFGNYVQENKTGFVAPLFDRDGDGLSINSTIAYLIEEGVPKEKMVIGFPTYGRGWTVDSASAPNSIPVPATGLSPAQPCSRTKGEATYYEICALIEKGNYTREYDSIQKAPYIFKNGTWFGYADRESLGELFDFVIKNDHAGAFAWTLDMDDFRGKCQSSNGTFPLIKLMKSKLKSPIKMTRDDCFNGDIIC